VKNLTTKVGRVIIAKIEPGEDMIDAIKEIVKKNKIKSGLINSIGAFKEYTIGYFDLSVKNYKFKTYKEDVELISCMGNLSFKDNEPVIHLHVSLGREDFSEIGGHLGQPSIISVTAEVYIYETDHLIKRALDPQFGLSLLDL
jgi:predicted DNA-binding protein with PD1-like motif